MRMFDVSFRYRPAIHLDRLAHLAGAAGAMLKVSQHRRLRHAVSKQVRRGMRVPWRAR